jgi:hypothetical protein
MAKKQLTLSIPTPCTEDWNNMTPDKNGKFCASCQKTVVDFSRMSDAELIEYFYDFKGSTCGRFNKKQVNKPLTERFVAKPQKRWAWALSALLLPNIAASQTVKSTAVTEVVPPSVSKDKTKKNNSVQHKIQEDSIVLRGMVVDEHGEILPSAAIVILGKPIGVIVDITGHFVFKIHPEDIDYQEFEIVASMVGYETLTMKINPFKVNNDMKIVLKESGFIMSGATTIRHYNFFQRTKFKIRNFFRRLRNN